MPTYSYRCTECRNAFDIQQSFTDDSLTVCESCGGPLRKVFNSIGVTFNGSGFYRTDSRSGNSSVPASKGSSGDSSKGSSGDSAKGSSSGSSSSSSSGGGSTSSSSSASVA
ncbi:FmdB family zinc ribbon protein [Agromyces aureus]|uniref:FmdB family transcriptional regulator n=1 Tax=Agromyces aureus TaxID=453304 RepID=A0A191WDW4_9MICO|nr:FmdB family zinc ribbon protein [Agromyces aureus]ANJ26412.1 FmdB family transcriptional regulator [Agromyces aureus]